MIERQSDFGDGLQGVTAWPFRWAFAALTAVVLAMAASAAGAQQSLNDRFVVPDVGVDIEAESAVVARDLAFLQGQRQALSVLVERLANLPGPFDTSGISDDAIVDMIQGFQVEDERTSPGRYQAVLTYVFRPEPVQALIRSQNLGFQAPLDQPVQVQPASVGSVLMLPVLRQGAADRLWDSPNPWLDAWLNYDGASGGPDIVVPFGDITDVTDISAAQAVDGDAGRIARIADRYGVEDTVVAIAEPSTGGISIVVSRFGPYGAIPPVMVSSDTTATADAGSYADAVQRTLQVVSGLPAEAPVVSDGPAESLVALVPLRVQADWFQTLRRLRDVARIRDTHVASLSAAEAIVEISYTGRRQDLEFELSRQGLRLIDGPDGLELRRSEDPTIPR